MNTEIEVRVLNIDKEDLISKLEKNNAKFIGDWHQIRYVYDFKPVDPNRWIRLRTNGVDTTLTIKEVQNKSIEGTKELEISVSSIETTHQILEKLGYKRRSIQENKRIRYILNDVEIDIDTWPGLNTYVEFEGNSEEEIKNILFEHYFGEYLKNKKQEIAETLIMDYEIIPENHLGKIRKNINFIIKYHKSLKSLGKSVKREIVVNLNELNDIINEKISNEGYEIDNLSENICYGFPSKEKKDKLNFITYNLKKKEKVKTKKKGCK